MSKKPTPAPVYLQAGRIIEKFGGHKRLAAILGVHRATIYRWTWPRERGGTGGVIPTKMVDRVIRAARVEGIFLSTSDLVPGP